MAHWSQRGHYVLCFNLHSSPIFLSNSRHTNRGPLPLKQLSMSQQKTPYVIFLVSKLLDSFPTISLARRLSRIYIEINNFALTAFHFSRFPLSWKKKQFLLPAGIQASSQFQEWLYYDNVVLVDIVDIQYNWHWGLRTVGALLAPARNNFVCHNLQE